MVRKPPYSSYAPRGGRSPARRKSAAPEPVERNLETGCIVSGWLCCCPFAPPQSLFLPSCPASSLFGPEKPFLVPSLQSRKIGAPAACQNAPLGAGPEDFFALLQKNTGPTFDRRGRGDTFSNRRGAAHLKQNLSPLGLSDSLSCLRVSKTGVCFPQSGCDNYRKESTGRVYRF
jgi:hypothetical protein